MMRGTKGTTLALALGAVAALSACKKSENATDSTAAATTPADTTMRAGSTSTTGATTAPATAKVSDADIFAMLHAANQGEIDAGKMAETKATNASVKAFARQMVTDHTKLRDNGDALAKKLNITPNTAAADSITSANQTTASTLTTAAKGAAFDSTYVDAQVSGHQATLTMIKNAEGQATNPQLVAALKSAEPIVSAHLDKIKNIQSKLK